MSTENIRIRPLDKSDWELLREIRIEMVTNNPEYFLESPDHARSRSKEDWENRLNNPPSKSFGFFSGEKIIGLIGVYKNDKLPEGAMDVGALYITPQYRGRGLSARGYESCLDYASGVDGIETIIVSHREGNEASRASILRAGFEFVGISEKVFGDGTKGISWNYKKENKQK